MALTREELDRRLNHHAPKSDARVTEHEAARALFRLTIEELDKKLPDGREKSCAITHLEEAHFWAQAAIARQPQA